MSFDVWAGDLCRALLSGATLVICPAAAVLDPAGLYRLLAGEKAECAEFVPATFMPLVRYLEATGQDLGWMRLVIVGSDRWAMRAWHAARAAIGAGPRLVNSCGFTEAAVDSTLWEGQGPRPPDEATVPVGWPLPGVTARVVGEDLAEVGDGQTGQLAIGGVGVSNGYLADPELTARKFIADPAAPGGRLYLTGDTARRGPGGRLELLGRLDEQVKIGGVRVEPGEAEAVLAASPGVTGAAVVAVTGPGGITRLAGYVTPASVSRRAVYAHAAGLLVPQAVPLVVPVAELPLTPNGKVDRRALAARGLPVPRRRARLPGDTLTQQVARVWHDVLGRAPAALRDDFFRDGGGGSLQAAEAAALLRARLGVRLDTLAIMDARTVDAIAGLVRSERRSRPARPGPLPAPETADVVVTGGTGAVGSFIVDALTERGYTVAVAAREESRDAAEAAGAAFIPADLADAGRLEEIAAAAPALIHGAWDFAQPDLSVSATHALIRGWRRGPLLFISSTDAADAARDASLAGPRPTPYGRAKRECEQALLAAAAGGRGPAAVIRPPHVWGPHARLARQLLHGDLAWLAGPLAAGDLVSVPGPDPVAARRYGDAWTDARDLARLVAGCLADPPGRPEVINAVTGYFSYYALARTLRRLFGSPSAIKLTCPAGQPRHRRHPASRRQAGPLAYRCYPPVLAATWAARKDETS